jgi:hypothetical protein
MTAPDSTPSEDPLLGDLRRALEHAPGPVREIEVGIALSIVLGRMRPAATCGGCAVPLSFQGIPAVTQTGLKEPFRLVLEPSGS